MNKKLLLRIISSLLILAFSLSTSAGGGGVLWKTIRVDAGTTIRSMANSSLKLDGIVPGIVYGSDHLYYATLVDGDHFVPTTVDNHWGVGMFASLAIDPSNGYPRISYYDMTKDELKYASYAEVLGLPVWNTTYVYNNDSLNRGGGSSAIALDNTSAHLPHIVFRNTAGEIRHAWMECPGACSWHYEAVDSAVKAIGVNIALAIDASNNLHIAYYDSLTTTLYYRKKTGSVWSPTTNLGYGKEPSLALTSAGLPAIAYETGSTIIYAANYGDGFAISIVYDDSSTTGYPGGTSLQLPNDDLDQPRISFVDDLGYVRLAYSGDMETACPGRSAGYDYTCDIIDDTSTFRSFTALALESLNGNINRLVYIDEATGELRYKFEASAGVWGSLPVDYSSNVGLYSSLAVDSTGPHISYYDQDSMAFKYAEIDDSDPGGCGDYGFNAWFRCDTVADGSLIGSATSVGIGYNNDPYIAFYDFATPKLMYAALNPSWSSYVIDESYTDVGRYPSLAFDRITRCGRIAYMDFTNGWIMYAEQTPNYTGHCGPDDTNWGGNRVEYISQAGFGISLAIDPNNIPMISYVDGEDHLVKVARYVGSGGTCDDNAWTCDSIAPGHPTEWGETSIWADDPSLAGTILVSFHDSAATTIMESTGTYSFLYGYGWVHETVDDAMYSGEENSITGIGVMPVIAYTDGRFNKNSLMLASRVTPGTGTCGGTDLDWSCQTLDSDGWIGFSPSIQNNSGRLYISYYDWTNGDLKLMFQAIPTFVPLIKKP